MRLAHFSDLHLLSLEGARILDFANKRWIGGLNLLTNRGRHYHTKIFEAMIEDLNRQRVDHILVTGDITNLALDEEFRFARELFDRLDYSTDDITVIPGNHDAYVQAGARYFAEHFAPFFTSDEEFGREASWPLVRRRGPLSIVGLSTSLQTPWFTAYGVIGEEQLDACADLLGRAELDGSLRLLAIHHCPVGNKSKSRIRGLRDRHKLWSLLKEVGSELILHGHEHQDLVGALDGPEAPIPVRGIPSGTYEAGPSTADRRARYRIYEISDGCAESGRPEVIGETLRLWDPEVAGFVEGQSVNAASDEHNSSKSKTA
jgi:3',5'-cyclic AMP phosphodiesterase CpdA